MLDSTISMQTQQKRLLEEAAEYLHTKINMRFEKINMQKNTGWVLKYNFKVNK